MSADPIQRIAIIGGGTAGWMAAAALARTLKGQAVRIELVESADVGTIGVGESTIPPIIKFLQFLEIDEKDFIQQTQASFKLAIKFKDWRRIGESYLHPFGIIGVTIDGNPFYPCWLRARLNGDTSEFTDYSPAAVMAEENKFFPPSKAPKESFLAGASYALHFDALLVAKYLRKYAESRGVVRYEDHVVNVSMRENGFIGELDLKSGRKIQADFYIDCTGFKGLLIEEALNTGYEDWRHYLPCDRAVAMPTENTGVTVPYTQATARDHGWTWRIPLQHRTGNGYVYCSEYCGDEQARDILMRAVDGKPLTEPRIIPFVTGKRKRIWNKNCLSLGLASGFLEPLESTTIHLVTQGIRLLIQLFPDRQCDEVLIREYNRRMDNEYLGVRDFIILHYCTTGREDTPFWRRCRTMEIPDSLREKIELFRARGVLYHDPKQLFEAPSWYCIFEGMGVRPGKYDPLADKTQPGQLQDVLRQVRNLMKQMSGGLPSHDEYLRKHCPAPGPMPE